MGSGLVFKHYWETGDAPHICIFGEIDTPLSVIDIDYTDICALLGHHRQAVETRLSAALRCILRHCGVRNSTPHSSGFARLASKHF
jgi:hypothetical protein